MIEGHLHIRPHIYLFSILSYFPEVSACLLDGPDKQGTRRAGEGELLFHPKLKPFSSLSIASNSAIST